MDFRDAAALMGALLLGLLWPTLKSFIEELTTGSLKQHRAKSALTAQRADLAAITCYESLGRLRDPLVHKAKLARRRSLGEPTIDDDSTEVAKRADPELRVFAESAMLLPDPPRARLELIREILVYVCDIVDPAGRDYHPDGPYLVVHRTIDHGLKVLAAFRRGEEMPVLEPSIREYELALNDVLDEKNEAFAELIEEDNAALERWRSRHGLENG